MAVRVAVRVRPPNKREDELCSKTVVEVLDNKTLLRTPSSKFTSPLRVGLDVSRNVEDTIKQFTFDNSYWSVNENDCHFTSQEKIFNDLGVPVLEAALEGYNACVFAYGQTGAGKTYTMMGTEDSVGITPRICKGLFEHISSKNGKNSSFKTEVSYLEIYNEHVRDLLRSNKPRFQSPQQHHLRVREHPKDGPYVEGLSAHQVSDFKAVEHLLQQGNAIRTTACTQMNDTSSRSHAMFTVKFTQAKFIEDLPSETVSRINLVDLAGSERAGTSGVTGVRLREGSNINKSLVTLGIVISTLADNALAAANQKPGNSARKKAYIPYRDSVLTWLLKDSLGGNSKTIMIAAISPAEINYAETLSTLYYSSRARNVVNKPVINEDPNVKLIRDLRDEIMNLRADKMAQGACAQGNSQDVIDKLHKNEAWVEKLTRDWTDKWRETQSIIEEGGLALRRHGSLIVLDSNLPYLLNLVEDPFSTGIMMYKLPEGRTSVGREDAESPQDIELRGEGIDVEHCVLEFSGGKVTLHPLAPLCSVNGRNISYPTRLNQGDVILLGEKHVFRFNYCKEAAEMREKRKSGIFSSIRF